MGCWTSRSSPSTFRHTRRGCGSCSTAWTATKMVRPHEAPTYKHPVDECYLLLLILTQTLIYRPHWCWRDPALISQTRGGGHPGSGLQNPEKVKCVRKQSSLFLGSDWGVCMHVPRSKDMRLGDRWNGVFKLTLPCECQCVCGCLYIFVCAHFCKKKKKKNLNK